MNLRLTPSRILLTKCGIASRRLAARSSVIHPYGGVAHGDLSAVTGWLREKVHQYGHLLEPAEVVRNACDTFDAHYYLDYLTKKYTELYNL